MSSYLTMYNAIKFVSKVSNGLLFYSPILLIVLLLLTQCDFILARKLTACWKHKDWIKEFHI